MSPPDISGAIMDVPSAQAGAFSTQPPPAHVQLIQMGVAIWQARAVYAAAELGLADLLSGGPRAASDLAAVTRTHAPSLYRLLRALAGCGLLAESAPGTFGTTALGEALRDGAPGAARATILTISGAWQWDAWGHFMHALRTGESGLKAACGQKLFDYLADHPVDSARFNEAMVGMHGALGPAIVAAYDFAPCESIVDIGGGTGGLISAVLRAQAHIRGALFDLPETAPQARAFLANAGLSDRCAVLQGDFFRSIPAGYQAHILSHVLHDWSDDESLVILENSRRAMPPDGRLLIIEAVLPEGDTPHHGKLMDLLMLTVTGGVERSAQQFSDLLARARFALSRTVHTATHQSIIEAVPV